MRRESVAAREPAPPDLPEDSLWLVKPGAVRADYDRLAQAITEQTGLSIGLEGRYHWIGFLPSRVNPLMPVPNQFEGLFDHGAMKIRGIEIRRSDAPFLVKRAQAEVLRCLSQARDLGGRFITQDYTRILRHCKQELC